jgi:hypothetical protein
MDEQTKAEPKINRTMLVVILVLFFFVAIIAAIAMPGFVSND